MTATSRRSGHRILVVEDMAATMEILCGILRARGDSPRAARTVEEALAAIEEEEFCGFVLDQELPFQVGDEPFISGGEQITLAARASDKRLTEDGKHVTPIVVLSGRPPHSRWVSGLFERGITAFVEKPLTDNLDFFLEKLGGGLEKGGRADHSKCAGLARRGAAGGPEPRTERGAVRLAIVGRVTTSGRTRLEINGAPREMADSDFARLLRCVVARDRGGDGWSSRDVLGIGESRSATSRIREPFDGIVPEGFDPLEGDRRGSFRLNPGIVVERIDWSALAEHPDAGVARIARERQKRDGGR